MKFFNKQPKEIKPGVLRESADGFIQDLTPEAQEKIRQSIIRGRESQKRMAASAAQMMRDCPEMAGTVMTILAMTGGSAMSFEATAALRWGVMVPPEGTEPQQSRDSLKDHP